MSPETGPSPHRLPAYDDLPRAARGFLVRVPASPAVEMLNEQRRSGPAVQRTRRYLRRSPRSA